MMINISEKNFEKYSRQIMMDKIGVSGQKKIMYILYLFLDQQFTQKI